MTEEEKNKLIDKSIEEILSAQAEKVKLDNYIRSCKDYINKLMELNTKSSFNKKRETGRYKITVSLDPTCTIKEEALAKLMSSKGWKKEYSDYIKEKTSHEITGARWRNLSAEDKAFLSAAVSTNYKTPSYKFEEIK